MASTLESANSTRMTHMPQDGQHGRHTICTFWLDASTTSQDEANCIAELPFPPQSCGSTTPQRTTLDITRSPFQSRGHAHLGNQPSTNAARSSTKARGVQRLFDVERRNRRFGSALRLQQGASHVSIWPSNQTSQILPDCSIPLQIDAPIRVRKNRLNQRFFAPA